MGAHSTIYITDTAARKAWVEKNLESHRKTLMDISRYVDRAELEDVVDEILDESLYNCRVVGEDWDKDRFEIDDHILERCIERRKQS